METAIDWVKQNGERLLVGAVIVISGVAFVVTVGGGGFLLLVPVISLALSDGPSGPQILAVKP